MDNPKPVFEIKDFVVKQARTMGQNGAHLKLKLPKAQRQLTLLPLIKDIWRRNFNKRKIFALQRPYRLISGMGKRLFN